MKTAFIWVGGFIGILVIFFILELVGLGFFKFFEPKRENIRREIFENTQSYTHGKIQDLAKYHEEYNKSDADGKETIKQLIILRFTEFDETKIKPVGLRNFLKRTRGY